MIALKLVRLIESHSEELAHSLIRKIDNCTKCTEFRALVPRSEIETRVYEVYRHLSDWLLTRTEQDVYVSYTRLGKHRFEQGVPFHQFFWAIMLVKENLWDFLQRETVEESAINLRGEFELLRMLDLFFDKVMYYSALGYWEAQEFAEREAKLARTV